MCIIVAKKSGISMPSKSIIENCFFNNPDGAGIMLAYKGKVFGFKGLMTESAFFSKLERLERRFGDLKKLPVVMHFRIGTHGTNIPENTHPFPLSDSYVDLRDLEWVASTGVAHNGIISSCSSHPDVRLENVSDTMVFIKNIAAPIGKYMSVTKHPEVIAALHTAADSKLCFLDGRGNLQTAGNFNEKDGVLYSNYSYEDYTYKYYYGAGSSKSWKNSLTPVKGTAKTKTMRDYEDDMDGLYPGCGYSGFYYLNPEQEKSLAEETAKDLGLRYPLNGTIFVENSCILSDTHLYAIDDTTGDLYFWDAGIYDWYCLYKNGDYLFVDADADVGEEDESLKTEHTAQ